MLAATLDEIDESALLAMCAERRGETSTLEWKQQLPDTSAAGKSELAKDVAALANSDGGDLVYGIAEDAGQANRLAPLAGEAPDAAERRIRQVLDSTIEPRIAGIEMRAVPITGGYGLILRVPASFDGPHAIWVNSSRRFVVRNGTGTSDMTYDQLRQAFNRTASLQEQVRTFVGERLRLLRGGGAPVRIPVGQPLAVLHVVPLSGLAGRKVWDVVPLSRGNGCYHLLPLLGAMSKRFNLDGVVAFHTSREGISNGYAQAYRDGCVETVVLAGGVVEQRPDEGYRLFNGVIVNHFRTGLARAIAQLREAGFSGPAGVSIAIVRAQDYRLERDGFFGENAEQASGDELGNVVVPAAWIEHLEAADVDRVMAPLLDTLWQAFGLERCPYFDATSGVYTPPR